MAKKKNKKQQLKQQLIKQQQLVKDIQKGRKTQEQREQVELYWRLKEDEKTIDAKFHMGRKLTNEDVKSLSKITPKHVKSHAISSANRINMLQDFAVGRIKIMEYQSKQIKTLTLALQEKNGIKGEAIEDYVESEQLDQEDTIVETKEQKRPMKIVRIWRKLREI